MYTQERIYRHTTVILSRIYTRLCRELMTQEPDYSYQPRGRARRKDSIAKLQQPKVCLPQKWSGSNWTNRTGGAGPVILQCFA